MMRAAVTLCDVAEAASGPFVFHGALPHGFARAAAAGFPAVELFLPGPDAVDVAEIHRLCKEHQLEVAAVGTGAGWLSHGLSLTDPDPARRAEALGFLLAMTRFAAELGAPAIVGSLQGRSGGGVTREQALAWLAAALKEASDVARDAETLLLYEPLNRYETNLFNRLEDTAGWLEAESLGNVRILADFFHMNLEEACPADAIRTAGPWIGHVHFADSNRRAMGMGHSDAASLVAALRDSGYAGFLSAEILPLPDPDTAARRTMDAIRGLLPHPP
jgi:sugar phosphate isomerase/epimerase